VLVVVQLSVHSHRRLAANLAGQCLKNFIHLLNGTTLYTPDALIDMAIFDAGRFAFPV
jgi:hypothetical protein